MVLGLGFLRVRSQRGLKPQFSFGSIFLFLVSCFWSLVLVSGFWIQDFGIELWILELGFWFHVSVFWFLVSASGFWIVDSGFLLGTVAVQHLKHDARGMVFFLTP